MYGPCDRYTRLCTMYYYLTFLCSKVDLRVDIHDPSVVSEDILPPLGLHLNSIEVLPMANHMEVSVSMHVHTMSNTHVTPESLYYRSVLHGHFNITHNFSLHGCLPRV